MSKNNFDLGAILKSSRKNAKETTRSLSDKIGFSHSYISSVENGSKLSPSDDFIQKYLLGIFENNIDKANDYIALINRLSEGEYNFKYLISPNSIDHSKANKEAKESYEKFQNVHLFVNKKKETFFEEPINDLNFHLNELNNSKFYKGISLTFEEMVQIDKMINNYLITIYETRLSQIAVLYTEGKISDKDYRNYAIECDKVLNTLDKKSTGDLPDLLEAAKEFNEGD